MPVLAFPKFLFWLLGMAVLVAAVWLLREWWIGDYVRDAATGAFARDEAGYLIHERGPLWQLLAGLALLSWSVLGRPIVLMLMKKGDDEPRDLPGERAPITAPDGSVINVESFGPAGAPTLVFTHGWGLTSGAWWYAKRALAARFRVVVWDLPGLGLSKAPRDGHYTIKRFADALCAVVESTGADKVVLVGHSIGGMTTQTVWRAWEPSARARVAGVVLVDTTYRNPLVTMLFGPLLKALQKPVIEPLQHLAVWLTPIMWLAAWQGYLNGSNQLAMRIAGFGAHATRGQVDYVTRLACRNSQAVQAKGNLAMFHWSIEDRLPKIDVPALILVGDRDIVTLPRASEHIDAKAPNSRLAVLPGGNHMAFMENHAACNAAIAAFADEALAIGAPARARARA